MNYFLSTFESSDLIDTIPLVDSIRSCKFWINITDPIEATQISIRFSLESEFWHNERFHHR